MGWVNKNSGIKKYNEGGDTKAKDYLKQGIKGGFGGIGSVASKAIKYLKDNPETLEKVRKYLPPAINLLLKKPRDVTAKK